MLHLSSLAIISVTGIIFQKDPCRLVGYFSWGKSWNSNSTLASVRNFVIFSSVFGEGNGIPLQYSCLENPMEGGAWWAAVHGVTKSQRRLSDFTFSFHFHALEKEMATHSSTLAWQIPWKEEPGGLQSMGSLSQTWQRLHFHFSLSCIGEGNGNPLQCSCLENPRDGGAWWAAIYGVTQSQT